MDGTKTTTNWIIAGLVALVVIIGGGWLIARERSGTMGTNATSTESTTTENATGTTGATGATATTQPKPGSADYVKKPTTASAGESISVADQPEGSSVTVTNVSVSKPTWVAVRDARPWYLGWKLVKANESSVTIPLQRNTAAGQTYEVVFFVDNGDGQFAIHGGDNLVTTATGAPVSSTFTAK